MPKRKIMFYRATLSVIINNSITKIKDNHEIIRRVIEANNVITSLNYDLNNPDNNSIYLRLASGDDLSVKIDSFYNNIVEGKIILCRRTLLPAVELHGNLADLELAEEEGLAEITHFKYYVNYGIMGLEYNFYGPKSGGLVEYFNNKLSGIIDSFELATITDNRYSEFLSNSNYELTMLSLKAAPSALTIINKFNKDLGSAFDAACNITNAEEIEITIKHKRRSKKTFKISDFSWRDLFEKCFIHREEFQKLSVDVVDTSEDERERKSKNINLLEDKLCVFKNVEVINDNPKRILSESIYHAIDEAFNECRDQLILL